MHYSHAARKLAVGSILVLLSVATASASPKLESPVLKEGKIAVDGRERSYLYYLPTTYASGKLTPLMVSFHGLGSSAEGQSILTGLAEAAERNGFIVVFPESTDIPSGGPEAQDAGWAKQWNAGYPNNQMAAGVDDVKFVSRLLDKLEAEWSIDRRRVYLSGVSNGAMFAQRAALELSERIAAVGCVVGTLPDALAKTATPRRAIPIVLFFSDVDPVIPFDGVPGTFLSAEGTVAFWASLDATSSKASIDLLAPLVPEDPTRIRRERRLGGKEKSEVVCYIVTGGGHAWPGGLQYAPIEAVGRASQQIDASQTIWDFVKRYSLDGLKE
jgi:polyhydroxybutyrate depolymerase